MESTHFVASGVGSITTTIGGPFNALTKIAATIGSIFAGHCLPQLNDWAKEGFSDAQGLQFENSLPYAYSMFYLPIAQGRSYVYIDEKKVLKLNLNKKESLGNQLEGFLFNKAQSLTEHENAFIKEAGARAAFLVSTIAVVAAKVLQLGLALLSAITLVATFGKSSEWIEDQHAFTINNLTALDLIETLCKGVLYTFHPQMAPKLEANLL